MRCTVRASAPVRASEDPAKVGRALSAVFACSPHMADGCMEGSSDSCESLDTVRQAIRAQRSGRAYLRMLRRNAGDDSTWLYLNKQAAHAGRVALCEAPDESPLGPITVSIRSDEIGSVIMWLVQEAKKN